METFNGESLFFLLSLLLSFFLVVEETGWLPSQSLTVGASSKRPLPVSDRDHFVDLTVNDFLFF